LVAPPGDDFAIDDAVDDANANAAALDAYDFDPRPTTAASKPVKTSSPEKGTRSPFRALPTDMDDDAIELRTPNADKPDETTAKASSKATPKSDKPDPAARQKQLKLAGAALAALVGVGGLGYTLFGGGDSKPKPTATRNQDEDTPPPKKAEPPNVEVKKEEKKEEKKKDVVATKLEEAPPPRPAGPAVPALATSMIAERAENPAAFDRLNRGRILLLRGTYGRTESNILYLTDGSSELGGVACVLPTGTATNPVAGLQPGQAVSVRGLLPFERPKPDAVPLVATAEQLSAAFETDAKQANSLYRYQAVQVTGRILSRNPGSRTVTLEIATDQRYTTTIVFTAPRYAALREEAELTVRGVCLGLRGSVIRIENRQRYDPELGNAALRTTADYMPLKPGRELFYDYLTAGKAKDNPVTRLSIKVVEPDQVVVTRLRAGTLPAATLFGDPIAQPKWLADLTKQKFPLPPQVTQFRVKDDTIETREVPPNGQPGAWWDPVLKFDMKKGDSWSTDMPNGLTLTYTVTSFGLDDAKRQVVEIRRVVKNPKDSKNLEERTTVYAVGLGETRRMVSRPFPNGTPVTTDEMRLVESESPAPKTPKDNKDPEPPKIDKKEPDRKPGS